MALAKSAVDYKTTAEATHQGRPGSFGFTIKDTPTSPQPPLLPNFSPLTLSKGTITITQLSEEVANAGTRSELLQCLRPELALASWEWTVRRCEGNPSRQLRSDNVERS